MVDGAGSVKLIEGIVLPESVIICTSDTIQNKLKDLGIS